MNYMNRYMPSAKNTSVPFVFEKEVKERNLIMELGLNMV